MAAETSHRFRIEYPIHQVKQPIIFHLIVDYHLTPNIRSAGITAATGGTLLMDIVGAESCLEKGLSYLRSQGLTVTELAAGEDLAA